MRDSLYTRVIFWVNTILNHIDTRAILPRYEGSCLVFRPKWGRKQKYSQIPILTGIKKGEILWYVK